MPGTTLAWATPLKGRQTAGASAAEHSDTGLALDNPEASRHRWCACVFGYIPARNTVYGVGGSKLGHELTSCSLDLGHMVLSCPVEEHLERSRQVTDVKCLLFVIFLSPNPHFVRLVLLLVRWPT